MSALLWLYRPYRMYISVVMQPKRCKYVMCGDAPTVCVAKTVALYALGADVTDELTERSWSALLSPMPLVVSSA